MESHEKIGYGLKNGQLVHVSEVSRGLSCECVCVGCRLALIARKGAKRKHHFAHHHHTNCDGGKESALHLLSKEIFQELELFAIPGYDFHIERKTKTGIYVSHTKLVAKGGEVRIDGVTIESAVRGFTPDVVIVSQSKKLLVEIAVTHLVDRKKMRAIRRHALPVIEIRLDLHDSLLSKAELRQKLRSDVECKHWLFHPLQKQAEAEFFAKYRNEIRSRRELSFNLNKQNAEKSLSQPMRPQSITYQREGLADSKVAYDEFAFEKAGNAFFRKHGRWPSVDECLRLWPWMKK